MTGGRCARCGRPINTSPSVWTPEPEGELGSVCLTGKTWDELNARGAWPFGPRQTSLIALAGGASGVGFAWLVWHATGDPRIWVVFALTCTALGLTVAWLADDACNATSRKPRWNASYGAA